MFGTWRKYLWAVITLSLSLWASAGLANEETSAAPASDDNKLVYAHKDWLVRCFDNTDVSTCEGVMAADIVIAGRQVPAFRMAFSPYENGGKLLVIFVPHEHPIYLPNGFQLYVDKKKLVTYPVTNCTDKGCFLQKIADQQLLQGFRRGSAGTLRVTLMNGQNLDVTFSLFGFSAAMRDLEKTGPLLAPEQSNE